MFSKVLFTAFALLGSAVAATIPHPGPHPGKSDDWPTFSHLPDCGEVNVFYTGFAAYHPYVADQHLPGTLRDVDISLRNGTWYLLQAGYNVQVVFQGPEEPLTNFESRLSSKHFDVTAIGFGIRGMRNVTATHRFEDTLYLYARVAPTAPTVFNWGPDSFGQTVYDRVPLRSNCSGRPGKLLGYEEICAPNICNKTTTILDGDSQKLLENWY